MTDKKDVKKVELTQDDLDNVSGGGGTFAVAFCVKCRHMIGGGKKYRVDSGWMCESCKQEEDLLNNQTNAAV